MNRLSTCCWGGLGGKEGNTLLETRGKRIPAVEQQILSQLCPAVYKWKAEPEGMNLDK